MTKRYKDFYGCTARITENEDGARLVIRTGAGKKVKDSRHKNFPCARSAMYRSSDGWHEILKERLYRPASLRRSRN